MALPASDCLMVAASTPVTPDLSPDIARLTAHCARLLESGCDGITLFGTTGEGTEFTVEDRCRGLDGVVAGGIAARRMIVSVSALAVADVVTLARHALDHGVDSVLLMPPCVYRNGITDEGAFRFFATAIDRIGRPELSLCLYHFPDICGVSLSPRVIRRLDEAFPGIVTGVKDSGGDFGFTEALIRSFSHLSIFTGSEIHLPQALALGARGTICGLGNVMPRLMRAMFQARTAFDRRAFLPAIISGDLILSRESFAASIKSVLAHAYEDAAWQRMLPPVAELSGRERGWMLRDFARWERGLPASCRSFNVSAPGVDPPRTDANVFHIRRA